MDGINLLAISQAIFILLSILIIGVSFGSQISYDYNLIISMIKEEQYGQHILKIISINII